jgi:phage-related protein
MTSRLRRSVSGFTGLVGRIACASAVRKTDRKGSQEVLQHQASLRPGGRIARVIFAFDDGTIVLLNGFIKKTRKAPLAEIDLALKRFKEMTS